MTRKRTENAGAPEPTPRKRPPGRPFAAGNRAAVGKGRPRHDAILDEFFEEVVKGQTREGQPFAVERRRAILERLYTSAMDTRRKDHGRLLEVVCAYYFGKPRERLEMSGPDGGPIESEDATRPPRRRTTGELRKDLDAIYARRDARMSDGQVAQQVEHYQRLLAERQARGTSPPAPAEQDATAPGSPGREDSE